LRQAALYGFLFGVANFALGFYWLYISMHYYGGLGAVSAAAAVVLLAIVEALFIVLATTLARWLVAPYLKAYTHYGWQLLLACIWASAWTLAEWLRGTLFTGFPWLNIGYAHVEGVLASWAAIFGVYGLAWLAAFASGGVALMVLGRNSGRDVQAATALAVSVLTGVVGIALSHVAWARPHGDPVLI